MPSTLSGAREDTAPPRWWRRAPVWTGLAIFVLAAALRLSLIETARFTGDEARDYAIGMEIARGRAFPLVGPAIAGSSACCLPGPLTYWLAAFPQLVTRAPEAGTGFYELLGAATVWMFWFAMRRPFGERGAAFAGLLMALSPWSAFYGDRVWNPHAFLAFEGLALLAAVQLRARPDSAWVIVLPIACLALPQLHLSAPVVWLALIPLVGRRVRLLNRRYLAIGLALALLLYIPFIVHEVRSGFSVTRTILSQGAGKTAHATARTNSLWAAVYALRFLTLDVSYHEVSGYWHLDEAAAWQALWHGSAARPFHPLRLGALLASGLLLISALVVAVRGAVARARTSGWRSAMGPFWWSAVVALAVDMLLLAATRSDAFPHYVAPVLPFMFALYANLGAAVLASPRPGTGRFAVLVVAAALIFCIGGTEATLVISRRIDGRNGLAVHRAVFERILDDARQGGTREAAAGPAVRLEFGFPATTYQYMVFARNALGVPIRLQGAEASKVYRLQKRTDTAPAASRPFPSTQVGPVTLYRLR